MRILSLVLASWLAQTQSFLLFSPICHCLGREKEIVWRLERKATSSQFSPELINDLDMQSIIKDVASHAVTLRGRKALLSIVQPPQESPSFLATTTSARLRRAHLQGAFRRSGLQLGLAENAQEARMAYDIVEQAEFVLQQNHSPGVEQEARVELPPFYGDNGFSPWDTKSIADSDDDEWLDSPILEWTLQDILKAEKIIERLLDLERWFFSPAVSEWTPLLATMTGRINTRVLETILNEISDSIKVVRVTTATDPLGSRSFSFSLSEQAFPVLALLRTREADLASNLDGSPSAQTQLDNIRQELDEKVESIRMGLCRTISEGRVEIDQGLQVMGELDVWFAKAAFGIRHRGKMPLVSQEPTLHVAGFVHPLLFEQDVAVPIDLILPSDCGQDARSSQALIISGANGGGKTLALKSFGVVAAMVKLGLPIPMASTESPRPLIGFFDTLVTSLGDHQSIESGQSTFMAQLSDYAKILQSLEGGEPSTYNSTLVLLDEIGSGTEAKSGGAIGQAILEHLLSYPSCCVVATTHSPHLKALSFRDDRFGCAAVFLEENRGTEQPSYRLEYGMIGESLAMEAASRIQPRLPQSVLNRAAALHRTVHTQTSNNETHQVQDPDYYEALSASLRFQKEQARIARTQAEIYRDDMAKCRAAMIQLAKTYDRKLGFGEMRVQKCVAQLEQDKTDAFEVLGNTLDEIRLVRKCIQSDTERLRRQGLAFLGSNQVLSDGEMVVVIDPGGTWDNVEGRVVLDKCYNNEICVSMSLNPLEPEQRILVARHKIAIWDYDSVFGERKWRDEFRAGTGREDSQQRLNRVLSSLSSSVKNKSEGNESLTSYTSSRERKAAKKRKRRKG